MAANEILPFGSAGTNELTQANYAADSQRTSGNQPGFARSELVNKVLHQTSTMSAGLAQFIADRQVAGVTDQLLPSQVASMLAAALGGASTIGNPGSITLPGGIIVKFGRVAYADLAADLTVTFTHTVAFPTESIMVLVSPESTQLVAVRLTSHTRFGATIIVHEFDNITAGGFVHYVAIGY